MDEDIFDNCELLTFTAVVWGRPYFGCDGQVFVHDISYCLLDRMLYINLSILFAWLLCMMIRSLCRESEHSTQYLCSEGYLHPVLFF